MTRLRSAALRAANTLSAAASLALVLLIIAGPGPRATTLELAALAVTGLATALTGAVIYRGKQAADHEENDR